MSSLWDKRTAILNKFDHQKIFKDLVRKGQKDFENEKTLLLAELIYVPRASFYRLGPIGGLNEAINCRNNQCQDSTDFPRVKGEA